MVFSNDVRRTGCKFLLPSQLNFSFETPTQTRLRHLRRCPESSSCSLSVHAGKGTQMIYLTNVEHRISISF